MGTRLKRMVIKEELVDLTGDFKLAIVLNQMMYWSERVHDFDLFLQEENEKLNKLALEQGAKKWSYVEKILINWADHKIQTIGQARAFVLAYKEKRNKKGASKINQSKRVEMLPDWFEESPQQLAIIPQKDLDERMRLLKERISKLS